MIDWSCLPQGRHRTTCPECKRCPSDRTLGITIEGGKGVAHCFRCQYVETFRYDRAEKPLAPVEQMRTQGKRNTLDRYGLELWAKCQPLKGTLGEQYLLHRRCIVPPGDLRFHPSLTHKPSGKSGPALVALITDAITGLPMSLHRTWITSAGKADLIPPRLLLGGHAKQGGVIRLWSDEYVTQGLGVAEGIETALSLAHAYQPVWACIDAGNLAVLPVLPGIECLMIAADKDSAGQSAARSCASRWYAAGADVRITCQMANDLNDTLLEALS